MIFLRKWPESVIGIGNAVKPTRGIPTGLDEAPKLFTYWHQAGVKWIFNEILLLAF